MPTDVYLYDAVRTPFGKYGGALACSKTVKSSVVQGSLTSGAKDATLISSQCGTTADRTSSGT